LSYPAGFTTGSLKVVAMSNCGSRAPRALTVTRLIPAAPTAITGQTSVCSSLGNNTQVTYSIPAMANATSYLWTVPAGVTIVSGQGTTSIVVTFSGAYVTSTFKVRSVSTCFTSGDKTLIVSAANYSTPGMITGPTNSCAFINTDNQATYKIRKVANAPAYIWTVPTGATIMSHPGGAGVNDTIINVSFDNSFVSGTSIIVQTTGCGTSAPRSLQLTGVIASTPGIISGPTNACEFMESVTHPTGNIATYTIRKVTSATSYDWTTPTNTTIVGHPGGLGPNDTIIQVKFNANFVNGDITVKGVNACGSSSARILTVNKLNPATPGVIDVINISTCPNRVYSYTIASMPLNATSVVWNIPSNGTIVSGQGTTSIVVSYPPSTVYGSVFVQGYNNCSLSSARETKVKLSGCATTFTSNTNNTTKQSALKSISVNVHPNPTTSSFNVQVSSTDSRALDISVLDVEGRMIKSFKSAPYQTINIGNELKSGVYMVEVLQGNEKKVVRVVKY